MAKQIARRMLVRLLGLTGLALAVGPVPALALARPSPAARLTRLLGDPESAREIGRAYLQTAPGDGNRERLTTQLAARLDRPTRDTLAASCREDFARGRTVMVNGWVLAETEARLCALAALG